MLVFFACRRHALCGHATSREEQCCVENVTLRCCLTGGDDKTRRNVMNYQKLGIKRCLLPLYR